MINTEDPHILYSEVLRFGDRVREGITSNTGVRLRLHGRAHNKKYQNRRGLLGNVLGSPYETVGVLVAGPVGPCGS